MQGGDASTRYLASFQDEAMATLKDSSTPLPLENGAAARGRDGYSLYGVLRTKPGRADSPPTLCMSCSDKIASWSVVGIQGALLSRILDPIYIDRVILCEVDAAVQDMVREDCERAFWKRLQSVDSKQILGFQCYRNSLEMQKINFQLTIGYIAQISPSPPFLSSTPRLLYNQHPTTTLRPVMIVIVTLFFSCQRRMLIQTLSVALCWVADSPNFPEVLINGLRRGVSPKHRSNPKLRYDLTATRTELSVTTLTTCSTDHYCPKSRCSKHTRER